MNVLKAGSRPRVIAVFGTTRAEVERAGRHTRTAASGLPVWAWCAEACAEANSPVAHSTIEGCDRLTICANASDFRKDLSHLWPSLSIIAWTGQPGHAALKLAAFTVPPFRVLLFNEAGDFFPARPSWVAKHAKRRVKDAAIAKGHAIHHLIRSTGFSMWSFAKNRAGLLWSLAWRGGQRLRDVFRLGLSLAWLTGLRIRDFYRLGLSFAWRTGQRIRDCVLWIPEALLALLAWAMQWTGPISHFLVERIRHKQRLATPDGEWQVQVVKMHLESPQRYKIPERTYAGKR
jgi:hypothetical protein